MSYGRSVGAVLQEEQESVQMFVTRNYDKRKDNRLILLYYVYKGLKALVKPVYQHLIPNTKGISASTSIYT